MSEKLNFNIQPVKATHACLDLSIEIRAMLETLIQYVALQRAEQQNTTVEEALKEVNALYQRYRQETLLHIVADYGEPDVDLGPLSKNET